MATLPSCKRVYQHFLFRQFNEVCIAVKGLEPPPRLNWQMMGWRLDPIFWFTVRLGWPWQKIIIFQWIDAVLARKASWIPHLQKENLSLKLTANNRPESFHAWKVNSGSFQLWGQNLAHFWTEGRVLPSNQTTKAFWVSVPKFLPRFASGTSTTRRPLNRIFDSESSLKERFFHPKNQSWKTGKVKVVGGEMVILSDFTFHFFLGDFKVNGCREKFQGVTRNASQMERWSVSVEVHVLFFGKALFPRTRRCPEECGDLGWNAAGTVHRKTVAAESSIVRRHPIGLPHCKVPIGKGSNIHANLFWNDHRHIERPLATHFHSTCAVLWRRTRFFCA